MNKRVFLSILLLMIFGVICVGVSFALLFDDTKPVKNIFTKANVEIEIEEEFDNVIKENVSITSNADTPIYLRVKLVCSLEDNEGNILPQKVSVDDFNIVGFNSEDWLTIDDVYYYKYIVNPNDVVTVFDSATVKTKYGNGENPVMTILAEGFQSNEAGEQWKVIIVNDEIVKGES